MSGPIDPFTPAVELAAAIRRKEISPVEVADSYLERIDKLDPWLNAFCHRADDDVRKATSAAADAVVEAASPENLAPFLGVPLPIKDLLDVAGWPTTYGSAGASPAPAAASDPVVAISLPLHHDATTGLPVGVQLVAAPWREDLLLQVARTLELAHPGPHAAHPSAENERPGPPPPDGPS
jgi:Asp-tRNA(Asn)/Glu-tRNA(Gln) amidotransferase A subunit family amidase